MAALITADGVRELARYAAWQNAAYADATSDLSEEDWWAERGAFFGSLGATANHIIWADLMWLSRFADRPKPPGGASGLDLTATRAAWVTLRAAADAEMGAWADGLRDGDLEGDLEWVSGLFGEMRAPRSRAILHMFNHATHHRGQVHAMLTAMGRETPTTDLIFLPDDA